MANYLLFAVLVASALPFLQVKGQSHIGPLCGQVVTHDEELSGTDVEMPFSLSHAGFSLHCDYRATFWAKLGPNAEDNPFSLSVTYPDQDAVPPQFDAPLIVEAWANTNNNAIRFWKHDNNRTISVAVPANIGQPASQTRPWPTAVPRTGNILVSAMVGSESIRVLLRDGSDPNAYHQQIAYYKWVGTTKPDPRQNSVLNIVGNIYLQQLRLDFFEPGHFTRNQTFDPVDEFNRETVQTLKATVDPMKTANKLVGQLTSEIEKASPEVKAQIRKLAHEL